MPTKKDHIDKARHNEQFLGSFDIKTTLFLDWVVSGIFYSALHYVDSYFANKGIHPGSHTKRYELIKADPNLGRLFFYDYMALKDDSDQGRYNTGVFVPNEIRQDILPLLSKIKTHLRTYIPEI